jgi:hypothetical protein
MDKWTEHNKFHKDLLQKAEKTQLYSKGADILSEGLFAQAQRCCQLSNLSWLALAREPPAKERGKS